MREIVRMIFFLPFSFISSCLWFLLPDKKKKRKSKRNQSCGKNSTEMVTMCTFPSWLRAIPSLFHYNQIELTVQCRLRPSSHMDSDDISHQSWASERNGTVESFTIVWSVSTGRRSSTETWPYRQFVKDYFLSEMTSKILYNSCLEFN